MTAPERNRWWSRLTTWFGAATITLMFVIPSVAAGFGETVGTRAFERSFGYSEQALRDFAYAQAASARSYAFPVLIPWIFSTSVRSADSSGVESARWGRRESIGS